MVTQADTMEYQQVVLNVGGQLFMTTRGTLNRLPNTPLAELGPHSPSYQPHTGQHFFDHSPVAFQSVLNLYRLGELHFPHCICGNLLEMELSYWGITEEHIADCCWKYYKMSHEDTKTMKVVKQSMEKYSACDQYNKYTDAAADCDESTDTMTGPAETPSGETDQTTSTDTQPSDRPYKRCWMLTQDVRKLRCNLWVFLEDPTSSFPAKIWALVYLFLILLSVGIQIIYTHPAFRYKRDPKPSLNITDITNPKILMFVESEVYTSIRVLDVTLLTIFSLDIFFRWIIGPSRFRFFRNIYNVIDVVSIVPSIILYVISRMKQEDFWTDDLLFTMCFFLSLLSSFKMLRLLKFARHYRAVRLLLLALRASFREQLLLYMLICIGVLLFSNLIFYAEFSNEQDFHSIPLGFWWAIVTMTTVGYGDIVPKTGWGYLVGGLCALCGMLSTGLSIPIIANNFNMYYIYAKVCLRDRPAKKLPFCISTTDTQTPICSSTLWNKYTKKEDFDETADKTLGFQNDVGEVISLSSCSPTTSRPARSRPSVTATTCAGKRHHSPNDNTERETVIVG